MGVIIDNKKECQRKDPSIFVDQKRGIAQVDHHQPTAFTMPLGGSRA